MQCKNRRNGKDLSNHHHHPCRRWAVTVSLDQASRRTSVACVVGTTVTAKWSKAPSHGPLRSWVSAAQSPHALGLRLMDVWVLEPGPLSGFPHRSGVWMSGLASSDTQPHLAVPRDTWLLGLNLWPTACKLGVASLWGSLPPDDSVSSPIPHCPKVTLRCSRSLWEPDICSSKRLTALTTTWVSLHLLLLPSLGAAASASHTCK